MEYTVQVYEAEEGGYWAEVVGLPGCASQGDSLDELERNVVEAIGAWLEAHIDDEGSHPPRPARTWHIGVPMDSDLVPA